MRKPGSEPRSASKAKSCNTEAILMTVILMKSVSLAPDTSEVLSSQHSGEMGKLTPTDGKTDP